MLVLLGNGAVFVFLLEGFLKALRTSRECRVQEQNLPELRHAGGPARLSHSGGVRKAVH